MTSKQGSGVRNALKRIFEFIGARKAYLTGLSCLVVFVATYLLILPALTLDQEEAARQGGIDVPVQTEQADTEQADTGSDINNLSYKGKGYEIKADGTDLPDAAELAVEEIQKKDQGYSDLYEEAREAIGEDADAFAFAKFYDISLLSGGEEVEPESPLNVTISYAKGLDADDADNIRIVHFAVDETTGETEVEVLDKDLVSTRINSGKMTQTTFEAESFSVYAVVYTVDFHWEVDGKKYEFSLPGGGYIGLKELIEVLGITGNSEEAEKLTAEVETVESSEPELVWVGKAEEDTTVGELKEANELECQYSAELTEEQIDEINALVVQAGDWALISQRSFTSEEHLTVSLKDGQEFKIKITDPVTDTNPNDMQVLPTADTRSQGVKMWLFDYDLDHSLDNQNNKSNTTNNKTDGINNESSFKFLGWGAGSGQNDRGINDFTGLDNGNGDNRIRALQGIVQNDLSDDGNGYPILNTNESLAYLFNPEATTADRTVYGGNKSQGNVNGLFEYKNGYYIYDSDEHYAELQGNGTDFTVYTSTLAQTDKNGGLHTPPRAVGFFPFDTYSHVYNDLKYENDWQHYGNNGTLYLNPDGTQGRSGLNHHLGVAMEMEFSIPKNGTVDGTANGAPINFNFSGDDDMWVFIDGHLVLDIGGLHQPVDGTIDFQSGTATIVGKATTNTSSDNTGANAIVTADGAQDPRGNDFDFYSALGITPGDGKTHTMKVFYLERGGCDSNCMISFNLPLTKGKANVKVAKCEEGVAPTKPLKGVKFGLYSDANCTQLMQEAATDASGNLVFNDLAIMEEGQTYYLKETKALAGYQMDDTVYTLEAQNNNGDYSFKVLKAGQEIDTIGQSPAVPVIYNKPLAPIELTVEKKWQDMNGHEITPPSDASATFKVERYFRSEGDVEVPLQPCTFRVYRYKENENPVQVGSAYTFLGGSQVAVNWGYEGHYYGGNHSGVMHYKEKTNEAYQNKPGENDPVLITLPASGEAAIYIRDENVGTSWGAGVNNISVDGTPFNNQMGTQHVSTEWAKDTNYTGPELTLPDNCIDEDHPWEGKFTNLKTIEDKDGLAYYYRYYITEIDKAPDDANLVYVDGEDEPISDPSTLQTDQTGSQKIVNKINRGSLKIQKKVTIDGEPVEDDSKPSLADGTYTFTILDSEGQPAEGKVNGEAITNGQVTITITNGQSETVEVTDLRAGEYTITEATPTNGTTLIKVNDTDITGESTDEQKTATITVSGDSTAEVPTAKFTNNAETTSVTVKKVWTDDTDDNTPISFILYRVGHKGMDDENPTVEETVYTDIDASGEGFTIDGLPVKGADGVTYTYTVVEIPPEGYTPTYQHSEDGKTWTITNKPNSDVDKTTDLTVEKIWKTADGEQRTNEPDDEIQFKLTPYVIETEYVPVVLELIDSGETEGTEKTYFIEKGKNISFEFRNQGFSHYVTVSGAGRRLDGVYSGRENNWLGYDTGFTVRNVQGAMHISAALPSRSYTGLSAIHDSWGAVPDSDTWTCTVTSNAGKYDGEAAFAAAMQAAAQGVKGTEVTYTLKNGQLTPSVPEGSNAEDWTAHLTGLDWIKYDTDDKATSVYRYEVSEISVNGKQVRNGQTDEFNVEVSDVIPTTVGDQTTYSVTLTNTEREKTAVSILKVEEGNVSNKLDGATFTIQKVNETITGNEPSDDTSWDYPDGTKITANGGTVTFEDLVPGYYRISEDQTPTGYIITGPSIFYIKVDAGGTKLVKPVRNEPAGTWSWQDGTDNGNVSLEAATAIVENTSGAALPDSGGPGTFWIYLIGSMLLIGCGVALIARRRTQI